MSALDLRVGAVLYPGRSLPEGVAVDASRQWVCIVALACATPAERAAVARGRVQVSWLLEGPTLLVSVLTEVLSGVCACSPAERTAPEDVSEDGGAIVVVVLVDAASTRVLEMRTIGVGARAAGRVRELEQRSAEAWATMPAAQREAVLAEQRAWTAQADTEAVALLAGAPDAVTVAVAAKA